MYKDIGKITLPDGRKLHAEVDERGNVRAALVFSGHAIPPPEGISDMAWYSLESRAISQRLWSLEHKDE